MEAPLLFPTFFTMQKLQPKKLIYLITFRIDSVNNDLKFAPCLCTFEVRSVVNGIKAGTFFEKHVKEN